MIHTGALSSWLLSISFSAIPGSFIAGIFFTSLFTLAPASIILAGMAHISSPLLVASVGAAGSVIGDLFLFYFVRNSMDDDTSFLLTKSVRHRLRALLKHPLLHWVLPITGAIIIASPLPDELGLALMGFSRMRLSVFIPISYAMNFIGIYAIASFAERFF